MRERGRRYRARVGKLIRGFSLVELLMVLLITGILASAAWPNFRDYAIRLSLTSASTRLFSSLVLARTEAIKRNGRVVLCKSADGLSCTRMGHWDQGWIVFADTNNDANRSASETLLQVVAAMPMGIRLAGNGNVAHYVSYEPTGGTQLVTGAFQAGTFTLCDMGTAQGQGRLVVVNATGRPRIQQVPLTGCA